MHYSPDLEEPIELSRCTALLFTLSLMQRRKHKKRRISSLRPTSEYFARHIERFQIKCISGFGLLATISVLPMIIFQPYVFEFCHPGVRGKKFILADTGILAGI
jgi:hypothetical protein